MKFGPFQITRNTPQKREALTSEYMALLAAIKNGTAAGSSVSNTTAMSFAAVFRAVELRSETIATLPIQIIDIDQDGRHINGTDPLHYYLGVKPNDKMTATIFWQQYQMAIDLWGDGFAIINRDATGHLTGFSLEHPSTTDVIESEGELFYKFQGHPQLYNATEVLHVPGLGFDGVRGKSRIQMHRETIAGGLSATKTNAKFWQNGAFFRGALELPGNLPPGKAEQISKTFSETWGGANSWSIPVLEGGAKFASISMPHKDAQYIDGLRFTVEEVARVFNVPLHKLKSMDGAKYNNVEQMQIEWVTDTVRPMVKRIENELETKLLMPGQSKRIKFNIDGLLRGDMRTRGEYYRQLFYIGALSPNEIRELENKNNREGGHEYFTPVNMVDAEQLELIKQNLVKNE